MRRVASIVLAIAVSAALLAWALGDVDFDLLGERLAAVRLDSLVPFALGLLVYFALKAARWVGILATLGTFRLRDVVPAMMIGFGANNVLPAHMGELVRAAAMANRHGLKVGAVLLTLVLERILDVVAVVIIYLAAVLWLGEDHPALRASLWIVSGVLVAGLAGLALGVARPDVPRGWLEAIATRLPERLGAHLGHQADDILLALAVLRSGRRIVSLLANSIAQWLAMAALAWISLWAVGEPVSPALAGVVLAATVIAVTLPSVPGYVGAIQAAFVFALTPFGVAHEVAFVASAYYLVGAWVPVTLVGLAFFVRHRADLGLTR